MWSDRASPPRLVRTRTEDSTLLKSQHKSPHTEHKPTFGLFREASIKSEQVPIVRKAPETKLVSGTDKEGGGVRQCMHCCQVICAP